LPGPVFRGMMGRGAVGKGNRTAIGGARIMDLLSPDDIASVLSLPFVVVYWPLILGAPVVFLLLARGYSWIAIPLAGLTLLGQAWHLGMFA